MNAALQRQVDVLAKNIESRPQIERILVLAVLVAGIVMSYLSLAFDPVRADIARASSQVGTATSGIRLQRARLIEMEEEIKQDPNKFANDRLAEVSVEQARLQQEIESLAGDLISANEMGRILTTLLDEQPGLQFNTFNNKPVIALRAGVSNAAALLQESGTLNFDDVIEEEVSGQVYEHGMVIEFEGDFFSTLRYLRFLEDISGSFYWDSIRFQQLEWPNAHITLEIHTLSSQAGFIGV